MNVIHPSISKYLTIKKNTYWLYLVIAAGVSLAGALTGSAFAPIGC